VRALRYYDEIGLVRPAGRTSAGHRRYTDVDVHRLYRVRALCQLGVPLEDIPAVLDSAGDDLDPDPYLDAEQRDSLTRHAAGLGDRTVDDLRAEFLGLVRRLRDLLRDGVPPADERVRALAGRWREIGETLRPPGPGLAGATAKMWSERGTAVDQALAGRVSWLDPGDLGDVVDYVRRSAGESR